MTDEAAAREVVRLDVIAEAVTEEEVVRLVIIDEAAEETNERTRWEGEDKGEAKVTSFSGGFF